MFRFSLNMVLNPEWLDHPEIPKNIKTQMGFSFQVVSADFGDLEHIAFSTNGLVKQLYFPSTVADAKTCSQQLKYAFYYV